MELATWRLGMAKDMQHASESTDFNPAITDRAGVKLTVQLHSTYCLPSKPPTIFTVYLQSV